MKTKFFHLLGIMFVIVGIAIYYMPLLWAAQQNTVVGDGTPASCDNNTLGAALLADGTVTFDCGAAPHTIFADTYVINNNIIVDGGNLLTLDGENLRQIFLVLEGGSLTLRNITLSGGFGSTGPGGAIQNYGTLLVQNSTLKLNGTDSVFAGGALANETTGTMTIEESVIENNSAADGGAIYSRGLALTIQNSTIRNNFVRQAGGGFYGGGAILQEINADAVLTILNSTIQNNLSNPVGSVGGGIALLAGRLLVQDSTLADNVGYGGGGAIYTAAGVTVELQNSRLLNNRTMLEGGNNNFLGGAIYNGGALTVDDSTLSGNMATDGGAIFSGGEGSSFILRRSTVSGNSANGGGGGLLLFPGSHVIENSTISGNTATIGGGIRSGITADLGTVLLYNVTLQNNSASNDGAHLYIDDGSQPITVQNTILGLTLNGAACYPGVALVSAGYNLARDESCGLTGALDQQNRDPLLEPLADNGGATQTHLPQPGSPAIDTALANCLTTDQRGIGRPSGAACDIGAVEVVVDAPTSTPTPTATNTNTPLPTATPTNTPLPTATPNNLNYVVTAVEITQAIQDLQNSVPLIRNKPAWVRAHVRRAAGASNPLISAQLWRIVNGVRSGNPIYPSNPGGKLAPANYPSRSQLNDSFYFPVPAAWLNAASLQVEVEVNPQLFNSCNHPPFCIFRWWRETPETNYSDNVRRSPALNLQTVPPMRLWLYNVVYGKKVGNTTNWYQASNTQLFEIEDWVRRAYPIAGLASQRSTTTLSEAGIYRWVKDEDNKDVYQLQAGLVNQRLNLVRNIDQAFNPNFIPQARYYGVVTNAAGDFMRGLGGGFIASGPTGDAATSSWGWWDKDNSSYGDWYAGHEIGHTWNRGHPVAGGYLSKEKPGCGHSRDDTNYPYPNAVIGGNYGFINIGLGGPFGNQWLILQPDRYYGFDIFLRGQVVYGPDWADMMSYCDKQWISDYTYNAIRAQMQAEGLAQAAQALGAAGQYALIQGEFSDDLNAATLDTILQITSPVGQLLPEPGVFAIHLRDASNTLLASYPFTPTVYEDAADNRAYYINVAVPYPAGVHKIEVRKGETLLAERGASANVPGVQVTSPNGGESIGAAGVTVTWNMSDADGDPLSVTVLFSRDNGQSWQTLAVDLTESQVALAFASLPGTTQGRIRVLVSDGIHTTQDESDGTFVVEGHAPQAAILAPEADATFVISQTVLLHGSGYDLEDNLLPDTAFVWQSDREGVLGTGAELAINTLSPGAHLLTLQVTDAANNTTSASRTITVGEDLTAAPFVLTVAPQTLQLSAIVGTSTQPTVTLAIRDGNASTGLTSPLTWNTTTDAAWLTLAQSSGDTPSDVQLSATTANLATGSYTATVTVSASNGDVQSVPVALHILSTDVLPDTQSRVYLPLVAR